MDVNDIIKLKSVSEFRKDPIDPFKYHVYKDNQKTHEIKRRNLTIELSDEDFYMGQTKRLTCNNMDEIERIWKLIIL